MKKNAFVIVFGIDDGLFNGSTLEKMEIHHGENKEENWKKNQKELHMPEEIHMPNSDIFLSPKISHLSPGDACMVFQSIEKVMSITKNRQTIDPFPHIYLVCGNGHVLKMISEDRDGYIWI